MLEKSIGLCFGMRASCTELPPSYHSFADLQPDKLLFLTVAPRAWRRDIWNCLLATRVSFRASRSPDFLYNLESF